MKNYCIVLILLFIFSSCVTNTEQEQLLQQPDWTSRKAENLDGEPLNYGKTYLPVYSHIYHGYAHKTFNLTVTVSIRNTSDKDTVYLLRANYFDTSGKMIRQYLAGPIFIRPMETLEFVIEEEDEAGGSGANFIFDWATVSEKKTLLFEAVMISTSFQQGLSFSTRGVDIHEPED